jgi:lactoylglutathione lyase
MKLSRTGIILNTENYQACVDFYRELFCLPILFQLDDLTCFEFMGSYLMIETAGRANAAGKTVAECPSKLRFNVPDIEEALRGVQAFGITAVIERQPWGSTINIHDPDGNRIGIRDEAMFMQQMTAGSQRS